MSRRGGPRPPTPETHLRMVRQRRTDTNPEVQLRRALHRRGLRFRLHRPIVEGTRRRCDIVFGPSRVAVEVRGCFWHGCPFHGTTPKSNRDWWLAKIAANRQRDADTEARLAATGWRLVVVWEHDDPEDAADAIAEIVRTRRPPA